MRQRTPTLLRMVGKIGTPEPCDRVELGWCWPWIGARNSKGYGVIRDDVGRLVLAHRVALASALGRAIRPGMYANHRCDYKSCVRPRHLYEGTPAENEYDKLREPKGETLTGIAS